MKNYLLSRMEKLVVFSLIFPVLVSIFLLETSNYESVYSSKLSYVYSLGYVVLVTLLVLAGRNLFFKNININPLNLNFFVDNRILWFLMVLILFGVGFHLYDKVGLRGYDYSRCISEIRNEWLQASHPEESIASSWQSALGYILTFMHFPFVWIAFFVNPFRKNFIRVGWVTISLIPVVILAYTIGSRSIVLLSIVHIVSCLLLSDIYRNYLINIKQLVLNISYWGCLFIIYSIVMMKSQIYCANDFLSENIKNNVSGSEATNTEQVYLSGFEATNTERVYLSGFEDELFVRQREKISQNKSAYIWNLITIYANNGMWNFEYTLHQKTHSGTVMFSQIKGLLNRLNIGKEREFFQRSYGKGMLSFVGSIWYEWSLEGVVIIAIFHAMIILFLFKLLSSGKFISHFLGLFSLVLILILHLFSPLVFVVNLMAFPFMFLSYSFFFFYVYIQNKILKTQNEC